MRNILNRILPAPTSTLRKGRGERTGRLTVLGALLACLALLGAGLAGPATAAEPSYEIVFTGTGGEIRLKGANARIQEMNLNVVDSTTDTVLESLPSILTDASGNNLQVMYNLSSEPSVVAFHFTRPAKNRFDWGRCAFGAIDDAIFWGALSATAGNHLKKKVSAGKVVFKGALRAVRFAGPIGFILGTISGAIYGCLDNQ